MHLSNNAERAYLSAIDRSSSLTNASSLYGSSLMGDDESSGLKGGQLLRAFGPFHLHSSTNGKHLGVRVLFFFGQTDDRVGLLVESMFPDKNRPSNLGLAPKMDPLGPFPFFGLVRRLYISFSYMGFRPKKRSKLLSEPVLLYRACRNHRVHRTGVSRLALDDRVRR